jgi:hypothetical protein
MTPDSPFATSGLRYFSIRALKSETLTIDFGEIS